MKTSKKMKNKLEKIITNYPKIIRKLLHILNILSNPKNYLIPETIDEYKFFFYKPKIKVNGAECYMNERGKEKFVEFIDAILNIEEIEKLVSYDFVNKTSLENIERAVCERVKKKVIPDISNIKILLANLIDAQKSYQFYRVIDGVELEGITSQRLGDVEIFLCDSDFKESLRKKVAKMIRITFIRQV